MILAAGESRRFGGIKQLAELGGKPLLQRAIDECVDIPGTSTMVVLGANSELVEAGTEFAGVKKIINARWKLGMSSSIQAAMNKADEGTQALLFLAADQVMVRKENLMAMIEEWRRQPDKIVAAKYQNQMGIPAIIPKCYWSELAGLTGDKGAKRLLLNSGNLTVFPLPEGAVDIDTRKDLDDVQP